MNTDPETLQFKRLRAEFPAPKSCTTFAYCLGLFSNLKSRIAIDANEACAAMSHQYDVEEQGNLAGYPEYVPSIFRPLAPVTLAKEWTPFPMAITLLGSPVHASAADYGKRLFVFEPRSLALTGCEPGLDAAHFGFLLSEAIRHAKGRYIMMCGSPGWSYSSLDYISAGIRKRMEDAGFVFQRRKPKRTLLSKFFDDFRR
jgi:hypothetical protein